RSPARPWPGQRAREGVGAPPTPGPSWRLGLTAPAQKRVAVRPFCPPPPPAEPTVLEAQFQRLEQEGAAMLDRAGVEAANRRFERSVDARYRRQSYELAVPMPAGPPHAAPPPPRPPALPPPPPPPPCSPPPPRPPP